MSTHTLLFFAPVAAGLAVGASLQLLHVTREAFLFVSACMLAYSVRDLPGIDHRTFWRRRFALVAVPYLCWTVIYFLSACRASTALRGRTRSICSTSSAPATTSSTTCWSCWSSTPSSRFCLVLVRKTAGHHGLVLLASGLVQVVLVSTMHWGLVPGWMQGYWATREVTSYQFYLVAGMVVAMHLDEFHEWLCSHVVHDRGGHGGGGGRGRGLVLPGGRPRGLVAGLELRSVPADRHPLQRRRDRLHLSDRRGPGPPASIQADPGPVSRGRTTPTGSTWPRCCSSRS